MKQSSNNKNRSNGRYGHFNNSRRSNTVNRNTIYDSTGPCGRIRGTAQQLIDKYLSAAKDAKGQNDRVLSEVCTQHADHYARQLQLAIQNERPSQIIPETTPIETTPLPETEQPLSVENQISVLPFMEVDIPSLSKENELQEKKTEETQTIDEKVPQKIKRKRKVKDPEAIIS